MWVGMERNGAEMTTQEQKLCRFIIVMAYSILHGAGPTITIQLPRRVPVSKDSDLEFQSSNAQLILA